MSAHCHPDIICDHCGADIEQARDAHKVLDFGQVYYACSVTCKRDLKQDLFEARHMDADDRYWRRLNPSERD